VELTEKQQLAVETCISNKRVLVTGGAGSGKTTVIRNIIERIAAAEGNEVIVLCAPTGKAAARITEASGYKAHTVHSACGFFPVDGEDEFQRQQRPPIAKTATTLIVDEASMLDDQLLAGICTTVPSTCRVILVGDPNQLPPVGAGYPFRDLIASQTVPHVHLDVCHRQNGRLLQNCYAILEGEADDLVYDAGKGLRASEDWAFIECDDERIVAALAKIFSKGGCEEALGCPVDEIVVLTPLNKGDFGRIKLNRAAQKSYHESRGRVAPAYKTEAEKDQFCVGDRVIWTKNDKELGLVNGDTGVVDQVGDKKLIVTWDGVGRTEVPNEYSIQLAWVLTCHKAQGSQYRKVLVIQAKAHNNGYLNTIINRSWVYTAFTRAKEGAYGLGSAATFRKHVATAVVDHRQTYLSQLLD
jgi:exodeoxyribonuclease V alpha subunit